MLRELITTSLVVTGGKVVGGGGGRGSFCSPASKGEATMLLSFSILIGKKLWNYKNLQISLV